MKTLLVITDWFPELLGDKHKCNFVKEYVDLIKDSFAKIYVISPQPFFPKLLSKIKLFKKYAYSSNYTDYKYDNVEVYYPNFFTIPINYFRKENHKYWLKVTLRTIKTHSIQFDLIHSHFIYFGWYIWKELKKTYNKKVILHCHDSPIENIINNKNIKNDVVNIFNNVDYLISFCWNYDKINNFININKIEIKNNLVNNFVNINNFNIINNINDVKNELWFNANSKILILVGNIVFSHKWHSDLLWVYDKIKEKYNNLELIIIWDWPDKIELLELIKDSKYSNSIHYLWAKNNKEIIKYLQISDLFIFPSRHESFGIVQIEALACGCPVIAYKNWWSEYILKNDKVWMLLEKQDKELLKEWIIEMLWKEYEKEYLHNYVKINFSWEIIKEKLLNLYFN